MPSHTVVKGCTDGSDSVRRLALAAGIHVVIASDHTKVTGRNLTYSQSNNSGWAHALTQANIAAAHDAVGRSLAQAHKLVSAANNHTTSLVHSC